MPSSDGDVTIKSLSWDFVTGGGGGGVGCYSGYTYTGIPIDIRLSLIIIHTC